MNLKINTELNVIGTRTHSGSIIYMRSAILCGYEIVDILHKLPEIDQESIYDLMYNYIGVQHIINVDLEFDVDFSDEGEINNVSLACVDINDIVSDEMEQELINKAKEMKREEIL